MRSDEAEKFGALSARVDALEKRAEKHDLGAIEVRLSEVENKQDSNKDRAFTSKQNRNMILAILFAAALSGVVTYLVATRVNSSGDREPSHELMKP